MTNWKKEIEETAADLEHGYILTDALKNATDDQAETFRETARKIADIEQEFTAEEIAEQNLLSDIW